MIIDTHCHLDVIEDMYQIPAATIVQNAKVAGVEVLQTISTVMADMPRLLHYTEQFPQVFCSVGLHPDELADHSLAPVRAEELLEYTKHPKVTAIGESGLDYFHHTENKPQQRENFIQHIQAARLSRLPMVIHARAADQDIGDILQTEKRAGDFTAVLHSFASGKELAYGALDLDCYISFSGIVTFKNAKEIQEVALNVPLDRMLVETDAPFLAPVPLRGSMNQPAYTRHTVEFLAQLRHVGVEDLKAQLLQNTLKVFSKMYVSTNSQQV